MAKGIEKIIGAAIATLVLSVNTTSIAGCANNNSQIRENIIQNSSIQVISKEKKQNIMRGNKKFREIALTFDYEAGKEGITFILDTLKKENVKATFFITGDMMKYHPDIIKRIVNEGHETGNHTYNHYILTKIKEEEKIKDELTKTDKLFNKITGKNLKYWRAP